MNPSPPTSDGPRRRRELPTWIVREIQIQRDAPWARLSPRGTGWWLRTIQQRSPEVIAIGAGFMVLVLGVLNALVDAEVTFSVFYLVPIGVVSWYISRSAGVAYSILCAGVWLIARIESGAFQARIWVESWDAVVRVGLFLTVSLLLSALSRAFDRERALARTDPITGVRNSRAFREAADEVIIAARVTGGTFTLAYLDLDDFKHVNDRLGHAAGDRLLRAVGSALVATVRQQDIVARLGGDEFGILLPDIDPPTVQTLLERVRVAVREATAASAAPVGFSIGAITGNGRTDGVDDLLRRADDLMYTVKQSGKNGIALETRPDSFLSPPDPTPLPRP